MKKYNKAGLHILFLTAVPITMLYFKWAAEGITSLSGLLSAEPESFIEIVKINVDLIIVSLLGSIPVFYWSQFYLTPKLLFKTNIIKIVLYAAGLVTYFLIVISITELIFPMYFLFGTPYAIKILAPIILLAALCGTLVAVMHKNQTKKFTNMISAKV